MNIHFAQVERKVQLSSYLLAAFAIFTALMLALSLSRHADLHWSVPSTARQVTGSVDSDLPVPVPAPLPPADVTQSTVTPEPPGDSQSILMPQVIAVPMPSMP